MCIDVESDHILALVFMIFPLEFFISCIYLSIYFVLFLFSLFSSCDYLLMFYERHLFFHLIEDAK